MSVDKKPSKQSAEAPKKATAKKPAAAASKTAAPKAKTTGAPRNTGRTATKTADAPKESVGAPKKSDGAAKRAAATSGQRVRYLVVGALLFAAFLGSYRYAAAKSGDPAALNVAQNAIPAAGGDAGSGGGLGSNCACCGSSAPTKDGLTGDRVEGKAVVEGDVQKISVDLSKGYYDPNTIVLKAGVPAEITFGQGSGCTAQVMSDELGFAEDLSAGPRTVKLPALEKGEYPFYCGMQMVFGKVVVE